MKFVQVNPKTNKKEKMIQCSNCCEWQFWSEYDTHFSICKDMLNKGSTLD